MSEDDYYLLRHSLQARAALMEVTLGDEEAFTAGTVQEILEMAKENLRRDLNEQLQKETSARVAAERQAEEVRQAASALAATAEQDKAAIASAAELERQRVLDEISKRDTVRRTNRRNRAVGWARHVARLFWSALVLGLVVGSFASYIQGRQGIQRSTVWYIFAALQGAIVLFGIANLIWGTSIDGIVRTTERWLTDRFEVWLAKLAGDDVEREIHGRV